MKTTATAQAELMERSAPPPEREPFDLLACVEAFILPSSCSRWQQDAHHIHSGATESNSPSQSPTDRLSSPPSAADGGSLVSWLDSLDLKLTPRQRLEHTCLQVCLADHIKTMQTMYRDPDDDLQVCLTMRSGGLPGIKLPAKLLQERILEGQIRIVALCRLCYGDNSLEYIRAKNDLISSFAQQGLWSQAKEAVDEAHTVLLRMCELPSLREGYVASLKNSRLTAMIVGATLRVLRAHVAHNFGHVTIEVVKTLIGELGKLPITTLSKSTIGDIAASNHYLDSVTRLIASVHEFIGQYNNCHGKSPSWGATMDFFRQRCLPMRELMMVVEDAVLPQYRASLLLTFQQCDRLNKRIAHSVQLSQLLHHVHNTSRAIAGCGIVKYLQQLKTEISLQIDTVKECVVDVSMSKAHASRLFKYEDSNLECAVVAYELPVSYEEVLGYIVSEQDVDAVEFEMSHLLTLKGIVQIFSGQLTESEVTIREALRYLEQQGLEMEVVACELYNTIAQLMIVKFRQAESKKKAQLKKAASAWLLTEHGRRELREQMKIIRAHYMTKNMIVISAAESELKARNYLMKNKMKEIKKFSVYDENGDLSPPIKMVDAAYRYVVRSFDILDSVYGQSHPAVATACLAVASVLTMAEKYGDAREWLSRALRAMEKLIPVPVRSIAYAQTQLSKVLQEGQYAEEAITVLSRAVMFYSTSATDRLNYIYSTSNPGNVAARMFKGKPYPAGLQPYDDADQAIMLGNQLVQMHFDRGGFWPAAEQAELLAELAELAYGWDSPESAELLKQAGEKYSAVKDFGKATSHFKRCLETMECLFDKSDPRCLDVSKRIQKINEERTAQFDNENPESPTNHSRSSKKAGAKKSKSTHSFTERLRAAWNAVPSTDLIRTTMELVAPDRGHDGRAAAAATGENYGEQVVVEHVLERDSVATYHIGPHDTDGLDNTVSGIRGTDLGTYEADRGGKRLMRQPKQTGTGNFHSGTSTGGGIGIGHGAAAVAESLISGTANTKFQFDDDLDLF
jgi:tetratricopeptide (TPR) repeat protein